MRIFPSKRIALFFSILSIFCGYSPSASAAGTGIGIQVRIARPIENIAPATAFNDQLVDQIVVTGKGFTESSRIKLFRGTVSLSPISCIVTDGTELSCTFAFWDVAPGKWDLFIYDEITGEVISLILEDAFTVAIPIHIDLNQDNKVGLDDVVLALQIISGIRSVEELPGDTSGTTIDLADAIAILKKFVGLEE
jgi:hypothetical protein